MARYSSRIGSCRSRSLLASIAVPCLAMAIGLWSPSALAIIDVTPSQVVVERRGRQLSVRWSTETEVGNVGFNVIGVRGMEEIRLNEELIPGAFDSLEPTSYELESGDPGVDSVLIEERDTHGGTRRHGPFKVDSSSGAAAERHRIDWTAIGLEQERLRGERTAAAARARAGDGEALRGGELVANESPRARLLVERDGIVRVTAEALASAGLSFDGQRLEEIALMNQGVAVPLTVQCDGGFRGRERVFGPGCFVEFLGSGVKSLYTKTNVYTLLVDWRQARRIRVDGTFPANGGATVSYRETTLVEKEAKYSFASPTGDPWYEADLLAYTTPVSREFPVDVDAPELSGAAAVVHVGLWGITDWPAPVDHHVVVDLNGTTLGERTFNGNEEAAMDLPVPSGVLRAGANTLRLTLPGDTGVAYDMVAVNRYGVTFDRALKARNGALAFRATGSTFQVRGLGGPVVAYRRIEGQPFARFVPRVLGAGTEQVVQLAGASSPVDYVVADATGLVTPRIVRDPGSSLVLAGEADLLVVAHPAFLGPMKAYAVARASSGLRISIVDVEAAYEAYGGGIVDVEPIRALIAEAHEKMGISSVLLVGGDTSDPLDYTGSGSLAFVPTPYVRTGATVAFSPTDSLYGDLNGDNVPEVAIGRWPVRTVAELEAVRAKTLAFANRTDTPSVLLAADKADGTYSFAAASETFKALLPAGWAPSVAYADALGVAAARQAILEGLSNGPYLANWFGHSSYGVWSFDRLFTTADAQALGNRGKPFVVTQWGCWNTYHVLPAYDTLGHALLLSPDRGAAAVIGAATLTDADVDRQLGQLLLPLLTRPGMTLGGALTEAKRQLATSRPGALDVLLGITLLGDPTLTFPSPR